MDNRTEIICDIDGNIYHTVTIGTQVWMVENLKTTKYNDGTEIPFIEDTANVWYELNAPGYCWYNDDKPNKDITLPIPPPPSFSPPHKSQNTQRPVLKY